MDARQMRDIGLDAYRTMLADPARIGPKAYGNNWPEVWDEYRRGEPTPLKRPLPDAKAIARADRFFSIMNEALDESARKQVIEWLRIKNSVHSTIRGFCEKNGLLEHQYRSRIDKLFQDIADCWKMNPASRLDRNVEVGTENDDTEQNRAPLPKAPPYAKIGDWKLQDLPNSADRQSLIKNLLRKQRKREQARRQETAR